MIHAYLMGLGDFNRDTYSSKDARVIWIMFIMATLIVSLIFMNLLIAIMGESFSRINGIMQQSTQKELCSIMEDHIWLQKIDELFDDADAYFAARDNDTSTRTDLRFEAMRHAIAFQSTGRAQHRYARLF